MNVVHFDLGRELRGGQRQVLLLHRELARAAVGSTLVARAGSPLAARCLAEGLPVLTVHGRGPWQLLRTPLRGLLAAARVVHSHDAHGATMAAVACRLEPRLAWVCHRRVSYPGAAPILRRFKYAMVRRWITVSREIRDRLVDQGVASDRCVVVPSAVDLEALEREAAAGDREALRCALQLADDAPVVGVVGSLTAQKGHQLLLDAVPAILAAIPACRLLVIGDGPLRGQLEEQARRLAIDHALRFVGWRDDVAGLLSLCAVVAAASVNGEGSPAAVKEPMALGVPVVASDIPGHLETLAGAAELVPAGCAAALAAGVLRLLHDPEGRARLAARGRQRVRRFSTRHTVAATMGVYRAVVSEG